MAELKNFEAVDVTHISVLRYLIPDYIETVTCEQDRRIVQELMSVSWDTESEILR